MAAGGGARFTRPTVPGTFVVVLGALHLLVGGLWASLQMRALRSAEMDIASDGVTILQVDGHGIVVGDSRTPYERIT